MADYRSWQDGDVTYTLCFSVDLVSPDNPGGLYLGINEPDRPRHDATNVTDRRWAEALWAHVEAHEKYPGDITGLCGEIGATIDAEGLREILVSSLLEHSVYVHNEPSDQWGIISLAGEAVWWCHNNGHSSWSALTDVEPDTYDALCEQAKSDLFDLAVK